MLPRGFGHLERVGELLLVVRLEKPSHRVAVSRACEEADIAGARFDESLLPVGAAQFAREAASERAPRGCEQPEPQPLPFHTEREPVPHPFGDFGGDPDYQWHSVVIQTTAAGELLWVRKSAVPKYDWANAIALRPDGAALTAGYVFGAVGCDPATFEFCYGGRSAWCPRQRVSGSPPWPWRWC